MAKRKSRNPYYVHPVHGKCVIIEDLGLGRVWVNRSFMRGTTIVKRSELKLIGEANL